MKFLRCLLYVLLCALSSFATASQQVYVYPLSQQYWDVRSGDSLSDIVQAVSPNSAATQSHLARKIVELNPDAFINNDPNKLRTNIRLWLPNTIQKPIKQRSTKAYKVERYSWGSVKRYRD